MSVRGPMAIDVNHLLLEGEIAVLGRLVEASNATLFCEVVLEDDTINAVYKPIVGEEPLWDFPDGTLAFREVASFEVSRLLGWDLVPETILRDGPYGEGMLQRWVDIDETVDRIALAQSQDLAIARMAIFDALINNTDRKIGHLLPAEDGRILGCDHGVTFHTEPKLRTVIWQFRGEEIPDEIFSDLVSFDIDSAKRILGKLLSEEEVDSFESRWLEIVDQRRYPMPSPSWPAVPWPPI
jgi:uncharacterized repeat protein (TIGR03843 family)